MYKVVQEFALRDNGACVNRYANVNTYDNYKIIVAMLALCRCLRFIFFSCNRNLYTKSTRQATCTSGSENKMPQLVINRNNICGKMLNTHLNHH